MKRMQTEKLIERFVGPYKVKRIILSNAVELELLESIKIYPVVNVSRIHRYKENSLEFPFNYCILLIHFPLFTTIYSVPCVPFHPAILYIQSLETKRKRKRKEI